MASVGSSHRGANKGINGATMVLDPNCNSQGWLWHKCAPTVPTVAYNKLYAKTTAAGRVHSGIIKTPVRR